MSFLIESWVNRARALWEDEAVVKLDTHVRVFDQSGDLIVPVNDPHPQYFNVISDTAWMGMHLSVDVLLSQGDVVKPYNELPFQPHRLIPSLANGTVVADVTAEGGYFFAMVLAFQAISNGGTFLFKVYINGLPTSIAAVSNLSNQSDVGSVVITGYFPIDSDKFPLTMDVRLESATKDLTVLDSLWTMARLFPAIPPTPGPKEDVVYNSVLVVHNGVQVVH